MIAWMSTYQYPTKHDSKCVTVGYNYYAQDYRAIAAECKYKRYLLRLRELRGIRVRDWR